MKSLDLVKQQLVNTDIVLIVESVRKCFDLELAQKFWLKLALLLFASVRILQ